MAKSHASKTRQASPMAVKFDMHQQGGVNDKYVTGWAVHSLFICSKKTLISSRFIEFFEHTNNLRTVGGLGVDKFTSHAHLLQANGVLVNLSTLYALK